MKFTFTPDIEIVGRLELDEPVRTVKELSEEPMIFSGDWGFATQNGGPLTQKILAYFEKNPVLFGALQVNPALYCVIDTRVTMTMRGIYPSLLSWHCDDVPRPDNLAQPELSAINPEIQHYCVLVSSRPRGVSNTELISNELTLDVDPDDVWQSVDRQVNERVTAGEAGVMVLHDRDIVRFDQHVIHRAAPAHTPGWRLFFRLSITHRKPANQIRRQVQVYAPISAGW